MNEALCQQLVDDVAELRAVFYKSYCQGQDNEREMIVQLAGQFLYQACVCLNAIYEGNRESVQKHAIIMIVKSLEQEDTIDAIVPRSAHHDSSHQPYPDFQPPLPGPGDLYPSEWMDRMGDEGE